MKEINLNNKIIIFKNENIFFPCNNLSTNNNIIIKLMSQIEKLEKYHPFYNKGGNNYTYFEQPEFKDIEPVKRHNIQTRGWTNLCNKPSERSEFETHYPVDNNEQPLCMLDPNQKEINYIRNKTDPNKSKVNVYLRSKNPYSEIPPSPPNGGLYGGKQSNEPWANIPVAPTTTNLINNVLKEANPPPGAEFHYPGTNRLGNNYQAMPGIYWYNPDGKSHGNIAGPLN